MKFVALTLLLLSVIAICNADSLPFKSCQDGQSVYAISELDMDPYPVERGKSLSTKTKGTISETLTGGTYEVAVLMYGVKIQSITGNLCDLVDGGCPQCSQVPSGGCQMSLTQSTPVPSVAPPGTYTIQMSGKDASSKDLFCVSVDVQIQ